jgi:DNA-binding MurR/RpiR family transcriptional regulator
MARQGCALTKQEVRKIILLLSTTDMTIAEISRRMSCSRSAVATISRKFGIRDYAGLRSEWTMQKTNS